MVKRKAQERKDMDRRRAMIVVLGDLARSPRMQYHCISLAKHDYDVTVIASRSAADKSCEKLESNKNIRQQLMSECINFRKFLPSILAYFLKAIWQTLLLILQLCTAPIPNVIIVQNPPSIPTLPVMYVYSMIVRSKLIIDWHNYGFSILSLNLGPGNPLVKLMKFLELFFGRLAAAGFCVSEVMQKDLCENYHITYPLYVLYDKPPGHFKPLSIRKKHEFFLKVQNEIPAFKSATEDWYGRDNIPSEHRETRFTITDQRQPSNIIARPDRPAIILSSTSWTEDENFDLLLNALQHYDRSVTNQHNLTYDEMRELEPGKNWLPNLVCVITGKGPLKQYYEEKIKELHLEHVEFVLPWLSAEDYAEMVGSCDLGISLHSSSSGVDLPMKVIDLFGCGIPVLACHYRAINELVVDDFYGLTFKDSQDLFLQLTQLLKDFYIECSPHYTGEITPIDRYKKNIARHFLNLRWETNWKQVAKPIFDKLSDNLVQTKKERSKLAGKKV